MIVFQYRQCKQHRKVGHLTQLALFLREIEHSTKSRDRMVNRGSSKAPLLFASDKLAHRIHVNLRDAQPQKKSSRRGPVFFLLKSFPAGKINYPGTGRGLPPRERLSMNLLAAIVSGIAKMVPAGPRRNPQSSSESMTCKKEMCSPLFIRSGWIT